MNKKNSVLEDVSDLVELLETRFQRLKRLIELESPHNLYDKEIKMVQDAALSIIKAADRL